MLRLKLPRGNFNLAVMNNLYWSSGKKKQHKHKLFGPDFPRTFLTLTPKCPGVKKFLPTTGAAGKRTFWCGRPRFSARTSMTRRVVEKLCTEKVCVDFLAPTIRHPRMINLQDAFDHDKGQKSPISGRCLHSIFKNFLQVLCAI